MGWLFFPRPANETPAEICARRGLRWNLPDEARPTIVKSVTTSEAVFFAVKFPAAFQALHGKTWCDGHQRAADGSFTGALIYLYKADKREFGYKDIDETMGPNVTAPSKAFLDALSPLTPRNDSNRHAHDWRARSLQACGASATI